MNRNIVYHFLYSLTYNYGGPAYSVPLQCKGVAKHEYKVSVITYKGKPGETEVKVDDSVYVEKVDRESSIINRLKAYNIRKKLNNISLPDLIHLHGVWMPLDYAGYWWAMRNHIPYVINPRGDLEKQRMHNGMWKMIKKRMALHLYSKKIANNSSCMIATSKQEAEALRYYGITSPIAIIPNGIDITGFPNKVEKKIHSKKTVLFLSRINPIKGIEYLVEAWSLLPKELTEEWELHIVGNSDPLDYVETIKKKVAKKDLQDNVKILGALTCGDKIDKYLSSDLFILPTLNENFGNVVAEALMCELPVITTKNAPWSGLLEYKCGWWVDLSVENLLKTLEEAMSLDENTLRQMGQRGRKFIIDNYSLDKVALKTTAVYNWVLNKAPKPDYVEIK